MDILSFLLITAVLEPKSHQCFTCENNPKVCGYYEGNEDENGKCLKYVESVN